MKAALVISVRDNVATALEPLDAGRRLALEGHDIVVCEAVAAGHKIAIAPISAGAPVIKYGSAIGIATSDIAPGAHVHIHNVASTRGRGDLPHTQDDGRGGTARLAEPPDDRQRAGIGAEQTATAGRKP